MNKRTVLSAFTLLVLLTGLVSGVLQNFIVPHQAVAAPGDALGEAWVATYDGRGAGGSDTAADIAAASDGSGNVYVSGYSAGAGSGYDYATTKYDSSGNELWVARYNGPANLDDFATAATTVTNGTSAASDMTFTTLNTTAPTVASTAAVGVSTYVAMLYGNLISLGTAVSAQVSFEWGLTAAYGNESTPQTVTGTGLFTAALAGLSPETTYHFRAKAVGDGTAYGDDMTFTTLNTTAPAAGTLAATGITTSTATLNGVLLRLGTAVSVQVSFEWGVTTAYGNESTPQTMSSTGAFSAAFSGLSPGTTYHFRAKAVGDGTAYGDDMTLATVSDTIPTVSTDDASSITTYSATLNGILRGLGTVSSVQVFFEWGPTTDYGAATTAQTMTHTGAFIFTISGLTPATTYHFRAVAVYSPGNARSVCVTGYSQGLGTSYDYTTVKYDGNGNRLWVARYNGPGNADDMAEAIAVDLSGNIYVTGYSYGGGTRHEYATVKYDGNGNQLWAARYSGPANGWERATAIAVDANGNAYVTGCSVGAGTGFDYATVKYQSDNGTQLWVARYNGPANADDRAAALTLDNFGNVYVTGYSDGAGTSEDYATVKYDGSNGDQLWAARYDGVGNADDRAAAVTVDSSDNFSNVYVTGYSAGAGTGYDYATVEYDGNGNQQWVARYNGPGNAYDSAADVALDSSGNVYVTGYSVGAGTGYDYATVKYDASNGNQFWVTRYDSPGNNNDNAAAIAVDNSGSVYVTGDSSGDGTGLDYATVKYDSDGNELWATRYNGPGNSDDNPAATVVDASGNIYIAGYSNGTGTDLDYATVKYDSSGNQLWVARYNGPGNADDRATGVAVDDSGNVCVTGYSVGLGTGYDYATIEYDSYGNQQWVARYDGLGGGLDDRAVAIAVDNSGNFCVTGYSGGAATDLKDYVTVKYDCNGNEIWVARYNSPQNGYDSAAAIAVDSAGDVYVTGTSAMIWLDYATVKYDGRNGNQLWVARYNGPASADDTAVAIAVDRSSDVCVTGYSVGAGTGYDYATLKYDGSNGNQLWVARYNGPGNGFDVPAAVAVDGAGNVYVTGDSAGPGTGYDYATLKYDGSNGNQFWVARYNGPGNFHDVGKAIAVDSAGNAYVTGYSVGLGTGVDYATVEYDRNGSELWVARYNGPANALDWAQAIAVDRFDNVYVTGYSQGVGTFYDYLTIRYSTRSLVVSVSPTEVPTPSNAQSVSLQDIPLDDIPVEDIPLNDLLLQTIGLDSIPLQYIPLQHIPLQHIDWDSLLMGTSLEGTPLQHITLGDLLLKGIPLQHITLADIFLAGIPVQDIVADSAPLQYISLQDVPLQYIDWGSILAGTDLENTGLEEISLRDLLLASVPLQHIPLQYIDILNSPLQHIPLQHIPLREMTWESILVGTPLQHVPLEEITLGDLVLNNIPLQHITLLNILLVGVPLQHIPLQYIPLQHINILGTPLQHIPLQHIPLQHITWPELLQGTVWENADLSTTSLGDLSLAVTPLQHITLQDIVNADTPLEDIPLDMPLEEIDIVGTPLQYITLQEIPLQHITWETILAGTTLEGVDLALTTLGDVVLAGISLQAGDPPQPITVEDIVLAGVPLQHIPLQHINILESPLQHIPLQHITLQNTTWQELLQDTVWEGADLATTTLGDIAQAGIPLQHIYLWDALMALIPLEDIPWESVPLQHIPLQDSFISQNAVTYTVTLTNYGDTDAKDVYITHALPDGFTYVAGSTTGGASVDPSVAGQDLTWGPFTVAAGYKLALQFQAVAGISLGTHFSSVSATSSNVEIPPATDVAPVTVVDTFEPNNSWDQAQEVSPDQLYLSYVSSGNDVDWYKISVPIIKKTMVTVYLSHLPADYDLTLIAGVESLPTDTTLQTIPLQDAPLDDISPDDVPTLNTPILDTALDEIALQDIPLQGIPLQDMALRDISIERGTADEVTGDKVTNETGYYYILVSGYNGACSTQPYTLRLKVTPPPDISPLGRTLPAAGPAGERYEPWGAATQTLIVTNEQRMGQYYGTDKVQALRATLEEFADRSDAKGLIFPVEQSEGVSAAYAAWDGNAGDPEAANAVAAQIRLEINDMFSSYPELEYVVIVGNDEIVPFHRVPDEVHTYNESTYAARAHLLPSALYYALLHGCVLTDDYYVDTAPVPWMGRELYVPDYAIGRLVETPDEIIGVLNTFAANDGKLAVDSALVTGYSFLSDEASDIAKVLRDHGITVSDLISENWTAADLLQHLSTNSDVESINAHCNHWQIGPPVGSPLESGEIQVLYVGGELVFSVGCHAGLNVSDDISETGPWSLDLAQALARSGAWFVGNTGYGYGDNVTVALSERLMGNFAKFLVSAESVAVGQALVDAKQYYFMYDMGQYGFFDEKAMIESTLYGLPMYQIDPAPSAPAAAGEPDACLTIEATLRGDASGTTTQYVPLFLNETDAGWFYSAWADRGDCEFTPYRPLQPQTSLDISYAGQVAHGVLFTGGTYQEYYAFDPVIARPVVDESLYEPQFINEGWYPSKMQTIMSLESRGTLYQNLVVIPGQFVTTSADTKVTGTERLCTSLNYDIYYSTSTDYRPPTIGLVNATASRSGASDIFAACFSVTVSDDEAVSKVSVTWTYHTSDATQVGQWKTIELTYDATSGTWTGELPDLASGQIDYLAQAVDDAGNVAVSTFKGLLFTSFPPKVSVNLEADTVNEGEALQGCGSFTDRGSNQWSATVDYGDGSGTQPLALASDNTFALSRIYADEGQYDILVMVKDGEGGVGSLGQTVTIVNAAPVVTSVTSDPVPIGTSMTVAAEFTDSGILDTHTAVWQWGDGTPDTPGVVVETNGSGSVSGTHNYTAVGVYAVTLTVTDNDGASGQFVVYAAVYDASAGFVTGAGLIDSPAGAYAADPSSAGKASFGFVSKYQKGTSVPTGRTSFRFHAADFTFESTDYQWMVIAGARVQYKGSGTVNGVAGYGFILTAVDGKISGGGGVDRFRIKVWNKATGNIVYDNQIGTADNADPAKPISAGNIVIHK